MGTSIKLLCLCVLVFVGTKCEDDAVYTLKIRDSVFGCDDFKNSLVDCSELKLANQQNDNGEEEAKLCGKMVTNGEILCEFDIEIEIWKMTDMSNDYMYNMRMNFGSSLKEADAPWYPVMQTLGIKECPVDSTTFEIDDLNISLDSLKDVMCHDFVGNYHMEFSFMNKTEKASCHTLDISIIEVDD